MTCSSLSPEAWPPEVGRLARWWLASTPEKAFLEPYHFSPRQHWIQQWLEAFQGASVQRRAWLDRLLTVCEEGRSSPSLLLDRFLKRLVQCPGGAEAVFDMRRCGNEGPPLPANAARVLDRVIGLLTDPGSLQLRRQGVAVCRLQWASCFGKLPQPAYLSAGALPLACWQFHHPFLDRSLLWLPLTPLAPGVFYLEELLFTHVGLCGFSGGGGFIHALYHALSQGEETPPVLRTEVKVMPSDPSCGLHSGEEALLKQVRADRLLGWHVRQGAMIDEISSLGACQIWRLSYRRSQLARVQADWAMGRLSRAI